ncbi:MAG TPA: NADH-quinone oxidoreductase subunit L [Dissulfurispiraceae bacterium]|nr:NADH-quinone oxidoreductase subunit L [Dissulfurispiraceae bacterium]
MELLWLVPALPLMGFLILALAGKRISKPFVALIGAGSVALSALATLVVAVNFFSYQHAYTQTLWTWLEIGKFHSDIALAIDSLSVVMVLVITFVGFMIHLYATESMSAEEDGYSRFFAYMNLFIASMLLLVLADNLLLLYLGWEGVGLCSYLLIGFWYKDAVNSRAAMKAFIVTRVGDTAMALGLFILYQELGTLRISEILRLALSIWPSGSTIAVISSALLLGGAVGKSAQIPLHTWLPDAMAGPTPVSALIHAATMVTAGVYLIARMNLLFSLAPPVMIAVAVIGAATLLLAGISALVQSDIKRALAYSTMSQIGYMFLALGVGAWTAAIFHFMVHAFFKALLFLSAGVVIDSLHHERDMFKMGGLRHQLPLAFWCFLIGTASLSALPLITAGFYSKDFILWETLASDHGSIWLWAAGIAGALFTSAYAFRMVFLIFYGKERSETVHSITVQPGIRIKAPLIILAALALIAGFVQMPGTLGGLSLFSAFMSQSLPLTRTVLTAISETAMQYLSATISLLGIFIAYIFFLYNPNYIRHFVQKPLGFAVQCFLANGWNIDRLYDILFVRPFVFAARTNRHDIIDLFYQLIALLHRVANRALCASQSGNVRRYAFGIAVGAALILGMVVFK